MLPDRAVLAGTTPSFRPDVRDALEPAIRRIAGSVAEAHGASAAVHYERRYPPTINDPAESERAAAAAAAVVGADNVEREARPSMGAEDFAFMLNEVPGAYVWLGNGGGEGGCMLHNAHYDFNDAVLPIGASYWAALVESVLPQRS